MMQCIEARTDGPMSTVMRTAFQYGLSPAGVHRFALHLWGRGADRPPLVCVHGLTRTGRDFDDLAENLSTDRLVACPDIVGRGLSDRLRDPACYSIPQYVQDMVGALSRFGDGPVDWVGTSMGGMIGMALAATPGNPIRRLVLNDVGPFISADALADIVSIIGDPVYADLSALRSAMADAFAGWGELPSGGFDHLAEFSGRRRPDGTWGRSYDPAIAEPMRGVELAAVDLWPLWQAITCPVLVLRGADSPVLDRDTAERMAQRADVDLVEWPGCGHAPSLMQADQIQAVREWLDA